MFHPDCLSDLEEFKLCLGLSCSVVVTVKLRQLLLDGGLVSLIQNRRRQVVLQSEIGLSMELTTNFKIILSLF